jgi:hypothetical protein
MTYKGISVRRGVMKAHSEKVYRSQKVKF